MKKAVAVLTLAAMTVGSGIAYAQMPGPGGPGGHMGAMGRHHGHMMPRLSKADLDTLADAKIAAIKTAMNFTPEQEKLFEPVAKLIRAQADEHAKRMEEWRQRREARMGNDAKADDQKTTRPDFPQILDRMAARTSERAQHMKDFADAVKPLWATLDERQKKLFPIVMRPDHGPRMAGGGWHHGRHHGRM